MAGLALKLTAGAEATVESERSGGLNPLSVLPKTNSQAQTSDLPFSSNEKRV